MLTALTTAALFATAGLQVQTFKTNPNLQPLAFAPAPSGAKVAATFLDGRVGVIDATTGSLLYALGMHPQPAYAIAWSHDGKLIASGDETGRVWIFDVATRQRVKEFRIHLRGVQALSFDSTKKMLLSTGKDDAFGLYNLSSWKSKYMPGDGASFYDGRFMPKSDAFVSATLREGARLYSAPGSAPRFFKGHSGQGALDCDVNAAGSLLATGGKDAKAIIWSIPSGKAVATLAGHQDWVQAIRFSPSGNLVATSCGTDRSVKIWDIASKHSVATLADSSGSGSPLGWSADGKYLLSTDINDHLRITKVIQSPEPVQKGKPKAKARKGH